MVTKLAVKQDEQEPVVVEVLANEIVALAGAVRKLRAGRLNERALVLLIQDCCGQVGTKYRRKSISTATVREVLAGIEDLERAFVKAKPKKDVRTA